MKLTLYSFFGGSLVFLGIIAANVSGGSLDLNQLAQFQFAPQLQSWAFPVLFLGFAVLAGIWPLHTWAPTGHVAAPTAGCMMFARNMLVNWVATPFRVGEKSISSSFL